MACTSAVCSGGDETNKVRGKHTDTQIHRHAHVRWTYIAGHNLGQDHVLEGENGAGVTEAVEGFKGFEGEDEDDRLLFRLFPECFLSLKGEEPSGVTPRAAAASGAADSAEPGLCFANHRLAGLMTCVF